eukprot:gene10430-11550_t
MVSLANEEVEAAKERQMEGEMFSNYVQDNGEAASAGLEMRRGWENEKSSEGDSLLALLRLGKEKSISCDESDVDEGGVENNAIAIGYSTLNNSTSSSSSMSSNNEIFLSDTDSDENYRLPSCILSDSSSSCDNDRYVNTPALQVEDDIRIVDVRQ